jgi:20S proteasome subunit beta 6
MVADIEALHKMLQARIKTYKLNFKKEPSIESLAQLLSNTLYGRRFMPYYSFNLLCGLDIQG